MNIEDLFLESFLMNKKGYDIDVMYQRYFVNIVCKL